MIRADLRRRLGEAVERLKAAGRLDLPEGACRVELSEPRGPEHGDFTTNFALSATKDAGIAPQRLAELLISELRGDEAFASAEVSGPGFVNLRIADEYLADWAAKAVQAGDDLAKLPNADPQRVLVEFASVNPNGPIHLGHGRGAAYGDALARVLEAAGHTVSREFYVNDGVNSLQMQLFALSVMAMYRKALGLDFEFPAEGYKGEYVAELAERIRELHGDGHADDGPEFFRPIAKDLMIDQQSADLARFGVLFDTWFSEQSLHDSGRVADSIEKLRAQGHAYEHEGALWLKTTAFGDDKDRCLIRTGGEPTYMASDVAYHKDKFDRGFDHLINVWGPDHHGYAARTLAAVQALGYPVERLELIITQIVRFVKDGRPAPMRKRGGELFRLSDLIAEVGVDVTRFFYLMRSHDTHMDFDLDLALEHSEKNPVYYVQYAHARICSLLKKAKADGFEMDLSRVRLLKEPPERGLIKKIWDLPYEVERAAEDRGVHRLTAYAVELARQYHNFYDRCRVLLPENPELAKARLVLCEAARLALRQTFSLLGISAPESM